MKQFVALTRQDSNDIVVYRISDIHFIHSDAGGSKVHFKGGSFSGNFKETPEEICRMMESEKGVSLGDKLGIIFIVILIVAMCS